MNRTLLSLITTIAGFLILGAIAWGFSMNRQMILLNERLERIQQIQKDKEQDRQAGMAWKYLTWLHWQVDQLRYKQGMEPAQKPALD